MSAATPIVIGAIARQLLVERITPPAPHADHCDFPGCALEAWHEGEHVPSWRIVQRYSFAGDWGIRCQVCEEETAAALYTRHDGVAIDVCSNCEDILPKARNLEAVLA